MIFIVFLSIPSHKQEWDENNPSCYFLQGGRDGSVPGEMLGLAGSQQLENALWVITVLPKQSSWIWVNTGNVQLDISPAAVVLPLEGNKRNSAKSRIYQRRSKSRQRPTGDLTSRGPGSWIPPALIGLRDLLMVMMQNWIICNWWFITCIPYSRRSSHF